MTACSGLLAIASIIVSVWAIIECINLMRDCHRWEQAMNRRIEFTNERLEGERLIVQYYLERRQRALDAEYQEQEEIAMSDLDNLEQRGIDGDLVDCLRYNPQSGLSVSDIKQVLAVVEGMNDAGDWHWIVELYDGRFAYLRGGCCYTGWDCESDVSITYTPTVYAALMDTPTYETQSGNHERIVHWNLAAQLDDRKLLTWREQTRHVFIPREIAE